MLLKHTDGSYAKAYEHEDGKVTRFVSRGSIEAALLDGWITNANTSRADLLADGWSIVTPTYETLTEGDELVQYGKTYFVLSASGTGRRRVYTLGYKAEDGNIITLSNRSADELRDQNFTIKSSISPKPKRKMTKAEVEKLVGEEVEIIG